MRDHAAFKVGKQYVEGKFCGQANQRRWICVGHRTTGDALIESCQNHVVTTVITPTHWDEVREPKILYFVQEHPIHTYRWNKYEEYYDWMKNHNVIKVQEVLE